MTGHQDQKTHEHENAGHAHKEHAHHAETVEKARWATAAFLLIGLIVIVTAYNQVQISDVGYGIAKLSAATTLAVSAPQQAKTTAAGNGGSQLSQASIQALADEVIPKGVPRTYGTELKVSYDDPVAAMTIMAPLDDGTQLNSEQLQRYTRITLQISCEYCCGAESIVFPNGHAACGCQHSYVMRGLAKYLITTHGTEYSDEQILEELGKWKTLFFPKQILLKAIEFKTAGKQVNTIDLTSNKYRGFKAQATASAGDASGAGGLGGLPNMVGGC
ncbi:hypothetical protein HZC09_00595 [Candidatus Micrarchaeota archaeon]|nr:hypothetical protein [Candidatus Micrarchaeota archaeon]